MVGQTVGLFRETPNDLLFVALPPGSVVTLHRSATRDNGGRQHRAVVNIAGAGSNLTHNCTVRSRKALPITDTELKLMAALAIIGLRSNPNTGNRTPAAMGTPIML